LLHSIRTQGGTVLNLELWQTYDRRTVHDIFEPETTFIPQSGSWGLWGIIRLRSAPDDFVFFVTFGQSQSGHDFDESVSEDAVLTWQSQPAQDLANRTIKQFIAHDDLTSNIYLFLRTSAGLPYTYMGRLGYLDHDPDREKPVHFAWQLLDGFPPSEVLSEMGLKLVPPAEPVNPAVPIPGRLTRIPTPRPTRPGAAKSGVRGRRAVLPGQDARNAALGLAGELLVLEHERQRLRDTGRIDLADQVVHTSVVEGDSAGFDIRSFNADGMDRYIEVKTTAGPASNAFFISPNEVDFSAKHPDSYVLVRVSGYDAMTNSANYYEQPGSIDASFSLIPSEYRARLLDPGT
jgi:Domain of unknown function (DUF3883)/Domain of unknown function (DUF3427)